VKRCRALSNYEALTMKRFTEALSNLTRPRSSSSFRSVCSRNFCSAATRSCCFLRIRESLWKHIEVWHYEGSSWSWPPRSTPLLYSRFPKNRQFHVRLGTCISDLFDQEMGVPQGSILSVTLFALMQYMTLLQKCLDSRKPNTMTGSMTRTLKHSSCLTIYTSHI